MIGRLSLVVGLLCVGATVFGFAFVIWTRYGGGGGFSLFVLALAFVLGWGGVRGVSWALGGEAPPAAPATPESER